MEIDGCLSDSCQEDKMSSGNLSPSESQEGGLKRLAMQLAKVIQILLTMLIRNIFSITSWHPIPTCYLFKTDLVHTAMQTVLTLFASSVQMRSVVVDKGEEAKNTCKEHNMEADYWLVPL